MFSNDRCIEWVVKKLVYIFYRQFFYINMSCTHKYPVQMIQLVIQIKGVCMSLDSNFFERNLHPKCTISPGFYLSAILQVKILCLRFFIYWKFLWQEKKWIYYKTFPTIHFIPVALLQTIFLSCSTWFQENYNTIGCKSRRAVSQEKKNLNVSSLFSIKFPAANAVVPRGGIKYEEICSKKTHLV